MTTLSIEVVHLLVDEVLLPQELSVEVSQPLLSGVRDGVVCHGCVSSELPQASDSSGVPSSVSSPTVEYLPTCIVGTRVVRA